MPPRPPIPSVTPPLGAPAADLSDPPTHSEDGVDLTLIRWMLGLTYEERLQAAQSMADLVGAVRQASDREISGAHQSVNSWYRC